MFLIAIIVYKVVRIVYVENDKKWHDLLRFSLPEYSILSSYTGKGGLNLIKKDSPDIVLLNNKLPDMSGLEFLKRVRSFPVPPPVIFTGTCGSPHDIVKIMHYGAADFLSKPYNLHELKECILRTVPTRREKKRFFTVIDHEELDALVGNSEKLQKIKRDILTFALSDAAVLISGETGTGKDIIAHTLHKVSKRRNGPYRIMPAGAIPFTLIESQLYGTEKGAFTDAVSSAGYFERSNRGTLFIDEIGEMSPYAQVKLLRIIEDREITRIGGNNAVPLDVRIVCATNINIDSALRKKHFRRDLYYRISTLRISVPPLRERMDDIPLLVQHFMKEQHYRSSISKQALVKLMKYPWPGNIRELRNVIHRAMVLSDTKKIEERAIIIEGKV